MQSCSQPVAPSLIHSTPALKPPVPDLNLRCLSLHSVAVTPDTYPASFLLPAQFHVKNKTRNRASGTQEAGPVPPPLPQDPDKQPVGRWEGQGREPPRFKVAGGAGQGWW